MKTAGFEKVAGTECLYRYRPNGKYYARFVANGKEVRRSLGTTDRILAKRKVLNLKQTAQSFDPAAERLTLAGLSDRYLATGQHLRPKTVSQKRYIVERIKTQWPSGADVLISEAAST